MPAFVERTSGAQAPRQVLRPHAEHAFTAELAALAALDDRPRPARWKLSPWAVATYLLGGTLSDGTVITPKYVGPRRIVEVAVSTLATDRALLLLGVPGTAKTWVSEHLAAAVSGDSTLLVQGTAGTPEEAIRYGWNYARLLAHGPSRDAAGAQPGHAGDDGGHDRPGRGADPHPGRRAGLPDHDPVGARPCRYRDGCGQERAGGARLQPDRHRQRPRPRGQRPVQRPAPPLQHGRAAAAGERRAGSGSWRLRWEPELSVRVAEAGVWGTTVLSAATARAEADALTAQGLAEVTALAERCLLAELPDALAPVMRILADRAALDTDVGHLAQALPALVRSLRYGDVRGTDTGALAEVAAGLAERVFVGLPAACAALDADAAEEMRGHVDAVHTAVGLLGDAPAPGRGDLGSRWRAVLRTLSARDTVPGTVRGRAVRLLLDDGELAPDEAARLMGLVLSRGTPPADAAAWIEGFVGGGSGGGMLLLHDDRLLALVDAWLTGVPADAFTDVLPLLRRTFSGFEPGVRRSLGELVRRGPEARGSVTTAGSGIPGFAAGLDTERADAVLPVVRLLLGRDPAPDDNDLVGADT
ncbi:hypothetical protein STENM36S_05600 [Streptomyces tendae]